MAENAFVQKIIDQRLVWSLERQSRRREKSYRVWSWTSFMAKIAKPKPGPRRLIKQR